MRLLKDPNATQMADILTQKLQLPQVLACVNGLLGWKSTWMTYGIFVLKRAPWWSAKAIKSTLRGCFAYSLEVKAEA